MDMTDECNALRWELDQKEAATNRLLYRLAKESPEFHISADDFADLVGLFDEDTQELPEKLDGSAVLAFALSPVGMQYTFGDHVSYEEKGEAWQRGLCLGCGIHTHEVREYYMVKAPVWLAANPASEGMLCIGCLEFRLGRSLRPADFTECPLNEENRECGSVRLRQRMCVAA